MRPRRSLSPIAVVAGGVAGASALAAAALSGLVPAVDPTPLWGAGWSSGVLGSDAVGARAVAERIDLARGLLALVAVLALGTVMLLLLGGREGHRPALAVRSAIGAGPRQLARHLVRSDARRLAALTVGGLATGLLLAALVRWTFPPVGGLAPQPGAAPIPTLVAALVVAGPGPAGLVALALLIPLPGLAARAPALLRQGHGVTDDPRAGTVRRGAATLQIGLSFALALTGLALVRTVPVVPAGQPLADSSGALALARFTATGATTAAGLPPSLRNAALGTPGVWSGIGVRDLVTVECGACVRGVFYLPVYGVDSTVHAVAPGVIEALGGAVTEGRALAESDAGGTPLVAVVNEAFRAHFEGRSPIGRRIRLSGPGDRWAEVVGVVSDPPFRAPGAPAVDEPVLWLPLGQHPARVVEGVAGPGLAEELEVHGWVPTGRPLSLGELRRATLAPVSWAGWALLLSGAVALALALGASAEVARVEARGRARSGAVRIALGAPPHLPALQILRRALRGAVQGVLLGFAVGWALAEALGVGGSMSWRLGLVLAGAVFVVTLLGARGPLRRLRLLQPAVLLRDE